ncbi:cell division protein FtsQ/DivIB [Cereibacter sphaeroides]|uniref:cell division protein FtsQ/DivIB n=1 Tax=Cereibacter sphaeroides TaxID=1063 RepID=UPI001F2B0B12|nr:cell division protein FtsQ/DivIB [Cereibacter sphaeroides]MCE6960290.1 cell division protein FtsQ/DivIB [Cereibacter sphaeroides]MCE6974901.1 cell division protein FtsQ/DivIB [Cereibacter sphaeroides]
MQSLSAPPPRRDPAPSRWAYRAQRLWLTPMFRTSLRVGLPVLAVLAVVALIFASAERRAAMAGAFTGLIDGFQQRPEFMVTLLSIDGASPELSDRIRATLALKLPLSSFDIDLTAARARIESIDAVASAEVRVRSGGVLEVRVTEREPAVIWRREDGLVLLDETGRRVDDLAFRGERADLAVIAGEGAERAVPEALQILAAAKPILTRVRGLVRMGERRWDIVLDRGQRILLPVEDPVAAVERMIVLDEAQDLLERDVISVDLRIKDRPVLRLAPFALGEIRRARGIDTSGSDL